MPFLLYVRAGLRLYSHTYSPSKMFSREQSASVMLVAACSGIDLPVDAKLVMLVAV